MTNPDRDVPSYLLGLAALVRVVSAPLWTKAAMEPNQIAPAIVALKERSAALRRYL
jgi:hypothetical protein